MGIFGRGLSSWDWPVDWDKWGWFGLGLCWSFGGMFGFGLKRRIGKRGGTCNFGGSLGLELMGVLGIGKGRIDWGRWEWGEELFWGGKVEDGGGELS